MARPSKATMQPVRSAAQQAVADADAALGAAQERIKAALGSLIATAVAVEVVRRAGDEPRMKLHLPDSRGSYFEPAYLLTTHYVMAGEKELADRVFGAGDAGRRRMAEFHRLLSALVALGGFDRVFGLDGRIEPVGGQRQAA